MITNKVSGRFRHLVVSLRKDIRRSALRHKLLKENASFYCACLSVCVCACAWVGVFVNVCVHAIICVR